MNDSVNLSLEKVNEIAQAALTCQGFSLEQAAAIATTITAAERDECHSHGLFRIPFYVGAVANPATDPSAIPVLSTSESAIVHVDGREGFCPLALNVGLDPLTDKARANGIAALAIHNCYNIAALWPEVEELANRGLVAFAFTCANAYVAPAGGTKPLFGTNPMAFAWPRINQPPLVFDQASSASARGEIQLHDRDGKAIPEGWAIDKYGNSTTDPAAALQGAQLTFGGYKGSSLALMIELLAGALIGDLFSYESSEKDTFGVGAPLGGEFVIAINPGSCLVKGDAHQAQQRAEMLFEKLLEQEGTRLPSQRRFDARQKTAAAGIYIPESLYRKVMDYT